jgi:hypothetical protein
MASEDSDQFLPGRAPVHRLGDLSDLDQTFARQVAAVVDHPHNLRERLEVALLRRPQWMLLEERDDPICEVHATIDDVLRQVLAMVVVPLCWRTAARIRRIP